jgi:hypothetical protein
MLEDEGSPRALPPPIHGTLAITQASQTIAAVGAVRVVGALAEVQAGQTFSAAGVVVVSGSLHATQAGQALAAAGWSTAVGIAAVVQAGQTIAAAADVMIVGALVAVQEPQTVAGSADAVVGADLAWTLAADALAATGTIKITADLVVEQSDQTFWYDVAIYSDIGGALYATQDDGALDAKATVAVGGALAITTWRDMLSATGAVVVEDAVFGVLHVAQEQHLSSGGIYDLSHAHAVYSVNAKRAPALTVTAPSAVAA